MLFLFDSTGSQQSYKSMFNMFSSSGLVSFARRSDNHLVLLQGLHNGTNYDDICIFLLNANVQKYDSLKYASTYSDYLYSLRLLNN